jgi:hypothetical protein
MEKREMDLTSGKRIQASLAEVHTKAPARSRVCVEIASLVGRVLRNTLMSNAQKARALPL